MTMRAHSRWIAFVVGLCALWALSPVTAGRSAPAQRAVVAAPLGGVNIGAVASGATLAEADRSIASARQLHAKIVRIDVPWSVLEPHAPNEIEPQAIAFTDRLMADASAASIKVIVTVDSTPCWESSAPSRLVDQCSETTRSAANAWPPKNPDDYASVVAYLAHRYGPTLAAMEIWNEPDQRNERYFAGLQKPQRYAALLRAAYPAIKQADPSVPVLAGSLVGSNGAFLRDLYAAGIKGYYDGLAVHFYTLTLGAVRSIRQVQIANGDEKPLWLDEFGWTSCWPHERLQQEQACVTPGVEGLNIANIFRSLAGTSYVAADVIYQLRDEPGEDFGVLSRAGTRKPAFGALAKVLASPFGPVSPVTLRLQRKHRRVLATGSGPVGDFMGLEVFKGTVLRYRVLFTLDRFNRFAIPLPGVLGTSGLSVRVFQYWAGSAKGARQSI